MDDPTPFLASSPHTPLATTMPHKPLSAPKSDYLRKVLEDRKVQQTRSQDVLDASKSAGRASARRGSNVVPSELVCDDGSGSLKLLTTQGLDQADDGARKPRPLPVRRASIQSTSAAASSPTAARANDADVGSMGSREADKHADKLSKENFDLKLRIYLMEEHRLKQDAAVESLQSQVSTMEANHEELVTRNLDLEQAALKAAGAEEDAKAEADSRKQEFEELTRGISRLTIENRRLGQELDQRDQAVVEAAGMIHDLEARVESLRSELKVALASRNQRNVLMDSGYYSAETDGEFGDAASISYSTTSSVSRPSTASYQPQPQFHLPQHQDGNSELPTFKHHVAQSGATSFSPRRQPSGRGSRPLITSTSAESASEFRRNENVRDDRLNRSTGSRSHHDSVHTQITLQPPPNALRHARNLPPTPTSAEFPPNAPRLAKARTMSSSERSPSISHLRSNRPLRNLYADGEGGRSRGYPIDHVRKDLASAVMLASQAMIPNERSGQGSRQASVGPADRSRPTARRMSFDSVASRRYTDGENETAGDISVATTPATASLADSNSPPQPSLADESESVTETDCSSLVASPIRRWDASQMRWPPLTAPMNMSTYPARDVMFNREEIDDFFYPKRK